MDETASGDEAIKAFVPVSAKTSITVNDATNSFIRTTGSFKADGFAEGVRFTIYGSHNYTATTWSSPFRTTGSPRLSTRT